jgi:hypothetical protein
MTVLIRDTTQVAAVQASDPHFVVSRGEWVSLRSTNMDGSGNVALYYEAPDASVDNPATDDNGTAVALTPTNPERIINVPGKYRCAVTAAATTAGIVFVNQ